MRWIPFIVVAYLTCLLQVSLGRLLVVDLFDIGPFGPDFLAVLAVFVGLMARTSTSAMMAGWILGMLADLTTGAGVEPATRLGPMSILFALAAGSIFSIREAIFREKALTQMVLATGLVILTHGLWLCVQILLAEGNLQPGSFGRLWLQVLLSGAYTGLLTPLLILPYHLLGNILVRPTASEPLPYRRR